jgi:predicted CXXCH cytochrome family protein
MSLIGRALLARLLGAAAFVAMIGFAAVSQAQITGSLHDFSGLGWSGGEICIVCHTPHNADTTVPDAPLWNHEVTVAVYTLYTSATLDAGPMAQPSGVSKLCLSCHDGTVAEDSFGGAVGTTFVSGSALVGTDLSNDHPISFTYDDTLAGNDGGLFPPSSTGTALGGTIDGDLLFAGLMECGSCHDVHNADGNPSLLRIDNAGSTLCLTCHDK